MFGHSVATQLLPTWPPSRWLVVGEAETERKERSLGLGTWFRLRFLCQRHMTCRCRGGWLSSLPIPEEKMAHWSLAGLACHGFRCQRLHPARALCLAVIPSPAQAPSIFLRSLSDRPSPRKVSVCPPSPTPSLFPPLLVSGWPEWRGSFPAGTSAVSPLAQPSSPFHPLLP